MLNALAKTAIDKPQNVCSALKLPLNLFQIHRVKIKAYKSPCKGNQGKTCLKSLKNALQIFLFISFVYF
jgi:hypothetical protein